MVKGGYGFHAKCRNIIEYVKKVNVERVRKEVDKAFLTHSAQTLSQALRQVFALKIFISEEKGRID
jgi:tRNA nucleotidyltransferase/poly(A) polymerase